MIRDAINRILELGDIHTLPTAGVLYADKKLYPLEEEKLATPIKTRTLTSIVDYIKKFKGGDIKDLTEYMIHVVNHEEVRLISALNNDKNRDVLMTAVAEGPRFRFGTFMENESFTIALQAMFVNDPETDIALIKKFSGTVTAGSIKAYDDDGVTQKATINHGVASKTTAIVPSPCNLRPYRTFTEVQQPASDFIFRMREGRDCVECALFASDGDAWKEEAMLKIAQFFEKELEGTGIVIIS